jgi:hypothetical protein
VAAWVCLDSLDAESRTAVSLTGPGGSQFLLGYEAVGQKWAFTVPGVTGGVVISVARAWTDDWKSLAVTYNAVTQEVTLFVGSQLVQRVTGVVPTGTTAGELLIGGAGNSNQPWTGAVDEARVFTGVLRACW